MQSLNSMIGLYGPTTAELTRALPDIGDGVVAALLTLHRDPSAHAAEAAAIRMDGVRRHCLQLADAIRRDERQ